MTWTPGDLVLAGAAYLDAGEVVPGDQQVAASQGRARQLLKGPELENWSWMDEK